MNAAREVLIYQLASTPVINLNDYPAGTTFNVQAEMNQPGSVRFVLTGPLNRIQVESTAPYELFGSGASALPPGDYQLTATPYPLPRAKGMPGEPYSVSFRVVRRLAAPAVAGPGIYPSPAPVLQLAVYPNPATGLATLTLEGAAVGIVHTRVIDLTGQVLREWQTEKASSNLTLSLDLSGLPTGVYEVQAVVGDTRASVRVVKGR